MQEENPKKMKKTAAIRMPPRKRVFDPSRGSSNPKNGADRHSMRVGTPKIQPITL